ncbi:GNAT family N-acetyltransferase [Streptomyces sp. NPDC006632]|uniref:GNAT family N-acetyltransferase n=1 Tax=unclassified Streptomyces TaxID=2593676 RepID=UPI002E22239C
MAALPGFQSHHRSVLTWPALIEDAGAELADAVLHSGARVLAFGSPFPDALVRDVEHETVTVWTVAPDARPAPEIPAARASTTTPVPEQWIRMAALWRATGITVLADSARDHTSWTHARRLDPRGHVIATASVQQLTCPVTESGARLLVCAVATSPDHRKKGAAAHCVRAVTAGRRAAALVEAGSQSARFFERLGWRPATVAHLYRYGS